MNENANLIIEQFKIVQAAIEDREIMSAILT